MKTVPQTNALLDEMEGRRFYAQRGDVSEDELNAAAKAYDLVISRRIACDVRFISGYRQAQREGNTETEANLIQNADKIAANIRDISGIVEANVWKKVAGKERIYITLMRADSNGKNFGGEGGRIYLDLNSGEVVTGKSGYNGTPFYNTYTLHFHSDNDTLSKIKQCAARAK
jgi:hypothetical protein